MSVIIKGEKYYRTAEVCSIIHISRNTLFRWLKKGDLDLLEYRDCRGWRLFNASDINKIKEVMETVIPMKD
jgi:predicted site-specific integrase-resolvase